MQRWLSAIAGCVLAAVLLGAIVLGLYHRQRRSGSGARDEFSKQATDAEQDKFSISSVAKDANGDSKRTPAASPDRNQSAVSRANEHNDLLARQQQAAAERAAAEQAAAAAELAERGRELEQRAAAQEAKEKQLEQDRIRVEVERQKAEEAAAEAERRRQEAAEKQTRAVAYSGPSSGSLVWQGEVRGTTLVTINGNVSDTGQVVSGALPGVLVMVQPADAKHVGVASSPAPSNSFRRLTLRIQGNGVLQEVIRWSIP